jgi:uncharacterized membrane protein
MTSGSQRLSASGRRAAERVRRGELLISAILRLGVMTSLIFVVAGTILSFVHHPEYASSPAALQRLTAPETSSPHALPEVLHDLRHMRGQAVVTVGLLLLILTPVLRVAASVFIFIRQGDRTYVLITAAVLGILLLSFVLGMGG